MSLSLARSYCEPQSHTPEITSLIIKPSPILHLPHSGVQSICNALLSLLFCSPHHLQKLHFAAAAKASTHSHHL